MTYRVGVVQNENELLRYSYADVRHLLTEFEYDISYYTAENIHGLRVDLRRLDGLMIATNACNHPAIKEWFEEEGQELSQVVSSGKLGLLVLFQMALSDERHSGPFPFLTEPFEISGQKAVSGDMGKGRLLRAPGADSHPVLSQPYRIDFTALTSHCQENPNVPGICWGHLTEFSSGSFQELVTFEDAKGAHKTMLVASSDPAGPRVVLSSLVLDWQRHDRLFSNCVRYAVEGAHPVAILRRRGIDSFELDLAEHVLRERKVPIAHYPSDDIGSWNEPPLNYGAILLDPSWPDTDIDDFVGSIVSAQKHPPIYFFKRLSSGRLAAASISCDNDFGVTSTAALVWLQAQYRGGLWDDSFWSTVDVLGFFDEVGVNLETYREGILGAIATHIQPDGSYDDVFGATCALLSVLSWLRVKDQWYGNALVWIQDRLPRQNLYNRATAIDLLTRIQPDALPEPEIARVRQAIVQNASSWAPGLETLRYMRTLVAIREFDQAQRHVEKLQPAAVGKPEWLTVFGAADTVGILLEVYRHASKVDTSVKRHLFSGLAYLLDEHDRDTGSWRQQTAATAKAAQVIARFSEIVDPAIGESLLSIADRRSRRVDIAALERFRDLTRDILAREQRTLGVVQATRSGEEVAVRRLTVARRWLVTLFLTSYTAFVGAAILVTGIALGWEKLWTWAGDWKEVAVPLAALLMIGPIYVAISVAAAYGWIPDWLKFLDARMPRVSRILRGGD
jgi:hypothetical protein